MRNIFLILLISSALIVLFPLSSARAAIGITEQPKYGVQVQGKTTGDIVRDAVRNVITLFFTVGAVGVIVMFLWGAVEWILSGGDKEKVAGARKRITTSLFGLALLSLSFVIIGIIGQILAIDFFGSFRIPSFGDPP